MTGIDPQLEKLRSLLKEIYIEHSAEEIDSLWSQLMQILRTNHDIGISKETLSKNNWSSSSVILITYADGIRKRNEPSLITLKKLIDNYFGDSFSIIHILPFLMSTSDGGFAVSNYKELEPRFGTWEDLHAISKDCILMADLVLNHVSSSHPWVQKYRQDKYPEANYILSPNIDENWSNVTRPRNSSLFTSLLTVNGKKDVWTTFGPDQIDLNWKEPGILYEFLKIIKIYMSYGITWLRLDAVGFIWKESKTTCLHLDSAHKIVRVLRILLMKLNQSGILITETNVPQKENLSYLQSGDQAHLAYNFPLPPLLLECLFSNKADLVNQWLLDWPEMTINSGFINFTASHDGIGLRALEGLMGTKRIRQLLVSCERRGGLISHRRMPNGEDQPYELNISWWSAMADIGRDPSLYQMERFLLSQIFVMSLKGIPAFYFQALMGSENDIKTFSLTGQRRDLNREKFDAKTLNLALQDPNSIASKSLKAIKHAIDVRKKIDAFHPDQPMSCLSKNRSDIVIIQRGQGKNVLWALHNMTNSKLCISLFDDLNLEREKNFLWKECLSNLEISNSRIYLPPYSVYWITKLKQ